MYLFKTDFLNKVETFSEIIFSFTGKAYHNVSCKCAVFEGFTKFTAKMSVLLSGIMTVHSFESIVTAALQRNMKLRTELFTLFQLINNLIRQVVRLK